MSCTTGCATPAYKTILFCKPNARRAITNEPILRSKINYTTELFQRINLFNFSNPMCDSTITNEPILRSKINYTAVLHQHIKLFCFANQMHEAPLRMSQFCEAELTTQLSCSAVPATDIIIPYTDGFVKRLGAKKEVRFVTPL